MAGRSQRGRLTACRAPPVPAQRCFLGNGSEYRGVADTAASGLGCLPWNSDLLYQELHVDSVAAAALLGLGPHAYCRSAAGQATGAPAGEEGCVGGGTPATICVPRNPDGDERPWCYVMKDHTLSWEYCRLEACRGAPGPGGVVTLPPQPLPGHCPLRGMSKPRLVGAWRPGW